MPQEPDDDEPMQDAGGDAEPPRRRLPLWKVALVSLTALLVIVAGIGWLTRERIVGNLISGELEKLGVPATYEIESIGARRQVIANLVIGDPDRPDLAIERVIVEPELHFGIPAIGRVTLVRPRLYGTYRGGKLSFGSLDPVIFSESEEPFGLPDLDLVLTDGRGLIESDYGAIGVKADGAGPLRDGFSGELAATAPDLQVDGCSVKGTSLYGTIGVDRERPRFSGPLRLAGVNCPERQARLGPAALEVKITADKALDGAEGRLALTAGSLVAGSGGMASAKGTARFTYRGETLAARYELDGKGIVTPQAQAAGIGIEGYVRALDRFARLEVDSSLSGRRLRPGEGLDEALASAGSASEGTLAGDVLSQIRDGLRNEARDSDLSGDFILRRTGEILSLVVPRGTVTGNTGQALLSVSRLQVRWGGAAPPRLTGNFATGGRQLPHIAGRMERAPSGRLMMRVHMPEYRAGSARLAIPRLMLVQLPGGGLGFAGEARVSGDLPGGSAQNLVLPLEGNWSESGGLSLWRRCVTLRFDRLELSRIALEKRELPVCPPRGGAIVRMAGQGVKAAGGVSALDLAGHLGETPVRITSGPAGFAWPGVLHARAIDVALGPAGAQSKFRVTHLDGHLGSDISGTFDGADVSLAAVPLDLFDTSGKWRFADGVLSLSEGSFRLEDREQVKRFQPLAARDATLRLADNVITADAVMREPQSDRKIVRARIRHDLATGRGSADLGVDAIVFDQRLQPDTLTHLALGVIANAEGVVSGGGRIDWDEQAVTSSGRFTTEKLDFAAAFGPVRGVSGTVAFTDLLGLVTAPDQTLQIAAINPGIEVNDGELTFAIEPDYVVRIKGARWPFYGGTLRLEPVTMAIGADDELRYTLAIEGLDAARFVDHMELGNLAATGTFDGKIPLVFDKDGGRLEGGHLTARPPGGNVSYVGELSYKDLSAIANFAFDALKSLNYREMTIGLDGALDGEMITRVSFSGLGQGDGTKSNFLTRRVAKLPIRFNVNVRAPFFQLITSVKSFYDPGYVRDPRTLGLLDAQGKKVQRPDNAALLPRSVESSIQPPESGSLP